MSSPGTAVSKRSVRCCRSCSTSSPWRLPNPERPSGGGRRTVSALIGVAVAVALLVWALRGVHFSEVMRHLRNARLAPLLAAVALATLTYPLRLVRWRLLLRADDGG